MVLLQKRADTKESYPGLFDASAAGHVSAGESCVQAALRETREELGVTLSEEQLRLLGVRRLCILDESRGFRSNEFNSIYLARVDAGHCQIHPSPDEISSVIWVDVGTLRADLEASVPGYCVAPEELHMVEAALMSAPEKAVSENEPVF
ncbi:MAG: NUDIX domain-containing protein [Clostridiales bacterium]|nr:NUDIX domain-containing protein [Clostridiales bacterium]